MNPAANRPSGPTPLSDDAESPGRRTTASEAPRDGEGTGAPPAAKAAPETEAPRGAATAGVPAGTAAKRDGGDTALSETAATAEGTATAAGRTGGVGDGDAGPAPAAGRAGTDTGTAGTGTAGTDTAGNPAADRPADPAPAGEAAGPGEGFKIAGGAEFWSLAGARVMGESLARVPAPTGGAAEAETAADTKAVDGGPAPRITPDEAERGPAEQAGASADAPGEAAAGATTGAAAEERDRTGEQGGERAAADEESRNSTGPQDDPATAGSASPDPQDRDAAGIDDESAAEQTSVIPAITDEVAERIRAMREAAKGAEDAGKDADGATAEAGPRDRAGDAPAPKPQADAEPEPSAPAAEATQAPRRPAPAVPEEAPDAAPEPVPSEPTARTPGTAPAAAEQGTGPSGPEPEAREPEADPAEPGPAAENAIAPDRPDETRRPDAASAGRAPAAEESGAARSEPADDSPGPDEPGREPAEARAGRRERGPQADERGTPPKGMREVPVPEPVSRAFSTALAELRESIIGLQFGLDLPGAVEARKVQAEILSQLGNYVIPRVHMSTAPALIVVAGSTGAGKSTVVNSLAGAKVSATGVRRPTTATPVLVCHPDDRDWFARGSVLSGLTRVTRPGLAPSASSFVLTSAAGLPENVALLDTPDIDSAVEEHHEIAHRMLDVADLWVFVTTAARYADAPSWHLLKLAKERGARLVIVVSRVEPRAREVVLKHFGRMLDDYGLGDVERFVIHETTVTDGRLPDEEIAELRTWLSELSVDDDRRTRAVRTTLEGALNSFRVRIPALARQLEAQVAFRAELRTDVDAAYMAALAEIDEATRNGSLLQGEVLARWQDAVGSGDIRNALHLRRPGRFAGKARQEAPMRLRALKQALGSALEAIIIAAAQRAAEDVVTRWRNRSAVGERLAATPGLGRPSEELVRRTGQAVSAWQDHIAELVRTEGVTKRSIARVLSVDVDSLAVIVTVGLLGYEFADTATGAAGSLPERLLRGLLGAEPLRNIAAKARSDLRARISMLFDEETVRHVHVLDSAGIPDESAATRLYQAAYNLEVAR